jgi:HAD superfamily hydrolase (TIGR01509 family)
MNNKAIIFDFDGVIVNSEPVWSKYEEQIFDRLTGVQNSYQKYKELILGYRLSDIYNNIENEIGSLPVTYQDFLQQYDQIALKVYSQSNIAPFIKEFLDLLESKNIRVGIVSSSRKKWIIETLKRNSLEGFFEDNQILSLNDSNTLRGKPAPDGYLEMMSILEVKSESTIVIEDSNTGIESAKESGATTICYTRFKVDKLEQSKASILIEDYRTLINLIKSLTNN